MQTVRNINIEARMRSKLTVLLADEHPLSTKIQRKVLEDGGFIVYSADSFSGLVNMIQNQSIDILMLDFNFKRDRDNLKFLEKMKHTSLNSELKIVLTDVDSIKSKIKPSIRKLIDHFIIKPIPKDTLITELKKLTSRRARKEERISIKLNSKIYVNNRPIHINSFDISKSGIHITDENNQIKMPVASVLKIEIQIPKSKHPIILTAVIIRRSKLGYGLKILDTSIENREKISKFIKKNGFGNHLEEYYL